MQLHQPVRSAVASVGAIVLGLGCAPAVANHGRQELPPAATALVAPMPPEVWATGEQSTVPSLMLRNWIPDSVHPIKERGCSFGGAAVPVCRRLDAEAFSLTRVNELVRLRGRLVTFGEACTQANCSEARPYCNRFTGHASIDVGTYRVMLEADPPPDPPPDAWPPLFHCVGDRSAQCCGFDAMGEEILAQGTLKDIHYTDDGVEHHQPSIEDAHICRVAPAASSATNRYVVDLPRTTTCP